MVSIVTQGGANERGEKEERTGTEKDIFSSEKETFMKVLAFSGSPRLRGNSSLILEKFLEGAKSGGASVDLINTEDLKIESCKGCLRCNILRRCSLRGDEWSEVSKLIEDSDVMVFFVLSGNRFHFSPSRPANQNLCFPCQIEYSPSTV